MAEYTPTIQQMADADTLQLYKWRIQNWGMGKKLQFDLADPRERLKSVSIPNKVYQLGALDAANYTFPNLDPDKIGEVVPIAYGIVRRAPVTIIDKVAKQFQVVGHAIKRYIAFYADDAAFVPTTQDISNGTFTWDTWTEDDSPEILVDFEALQNNPIDVIEDLLTTWGGEPDANLFMPDASDALAGQGFGVDGARLKYIRGTNVDGPFAGEEVAKFAINLYLGTDKDLLAWVEEVAAVAGALFYATPEGLLTIRSWEALQCEDFPRFVYEDGTLLSFDPDSQTDDVVTKIRVTYREIQSGESQFVEVINNTAMRRRGLKEHALLEVNGNVETKRDALLLAYRTMEMRSNPLRIFKVKVDRSALDIQPGDGVWLSWGDMGLDHPFEVLEIAYKAGQTFVQLTLGDWRGFRDRPGFWASDSEVAPSYYGGESVDTWQDGSAGWNDEELRYAQTNIGYWTNDDGFAASGDEASRDYSVWCP